MKNIKNKTELVKYIRNECKKRGVRLLIYKSKDHKVAYQGTSIRCAGYYSHQDKLLKMAWRKNSVSFIGLLLHEFNHVLQFCDDASNPVVKRYLKSNAPSRFDDYIEGKHYSKAQIKKDIQVVQDIERDCEERTIKMLNQLSFIKKISVVKYTQLANVYLLAHHNMVERRAFSSNPSPYNYQKLPKNLVKNLGSLKYYSILENCFSEPKAMSLS